MNIAQELNIGLVVLLTGLVVVFCALIFLTFIIKGYGNVISSIVDKKKKQTVKTEVKKSEPAKASASAVPAKKIESGIPGEIVAAIAGAVDYMYGAGTYAVRSIKRIPQNRSAWMNAGLSENTRPFKNI